MGELFLAWTLESLRRADLSKARINKCLAVRHKQNVVYEII